MIIEEGKREETAQKLLEWLAKNAGECPWKWDDLLTHVRSYGRVSDGQMRWMQAMGIVQMSADEFKAHVRGMSAARVGELVGRKADAIHSYVCGRQPVPPDVAEMAWKIDVMLHSLKKS